MWLLPHTPGTRGEPQARELLAGVFDTSPEALPLTRDERSRPWLIGELAHYGTGWSHSGGHLLVALGEHEAVRDAPRRYLNRLSDLMFVLARVLNRHRADGSVGDDVYWKSERLANAEE